MDNSRVFGIIMIGLVVLNLAWTASVSQQTGELQEKMSNLREQQDALESVVVGETAENGGSFSSVPQATVSLIAYEPDTENATLVPVTVTSTPGNGVYVDVAEVMYQRSTQDSFLIARSLVRNSSFHPRYEGMVVGLETPRDWSVVSGQSASLGVAMAMAATDERVTVREGVALTGGLTREGRVTRVKHIEEKARAVKKSDKEILVVPEGQHIEVEGVQVVEAETFAEAAKTVLVQDQ